VSLKTLHLTSAWHQESGGIATFYRELLAAAGRQGRLIRLVAPGETSRVEEAGPHGRIYYVKAPRAPFNPAYRVLYPHHYLLPGGEIRRILNDERPDLVEVCDKLTLPYLAGLLRVGWLPGVRFRPVTVGLSCERLEDTVAAYTRLGKLGRTLSRWYMKWLYFPQFDHHLAVSGHTAGELARAARGHKVERAVWVAPMGADIARFHPGLRSPEGRRRVAQRAGVQPEAALLLYAGRLAPEKNLELLLDMMERLVNEGGRDYRLLIAGAGCSEPQLRAGAERRTPGRVRFLGHIQDRDELAATYANVDAFVHPNPAEPFGIAPLEAMAAGVPLVAPNRGGVTTFANPSNAWLAEPRGESFAAAVVDVLGGGATRAARTQAARRTAIDHRWERSTEEYLRLYEEIRDRAHGKRTARQRPPRHVSTPGNLFGMETRRRFLAALCGALAGTPPAAASPGAGLRRYRADATILLFGLPLYFRSGAGAGYVMAQERERPGGRDVAIQFSAWTLPERARGLRRFGFFQELVAERGPAAEQAHYLGCMSVSPEHRLDEARQAAPAGGPVAPFNAIQGSAGGGWFRNRVLRTMLPAGLAPEKCPELPHTIRRVFEQARAADVVESATPAGHARTFLYALRASLLDSRRSGEAPFLYNGGHYLLRFSKQPDARLGRHFAERQLAPDPARLVRLNGVIVHLGDRSRSEFKLWFDPGAEVVLPLRFEYRARAFLNLAFDHDPSLSEPAAISLFQQEAL
jgi:alpha-1,6-mannosyltransferase